MNDARYLRWFASLSMNDLALVGGKNASLGEMVQQLQGLCDQLDHMIHQVQDLSKSIGLEEERTQLKAVRESLAQHAQGMLRGLERLTREQTAWDHTEAQR